MILLLVARPFPYTAAASHAWKQDTDRQLFGPIELSQHCVWCFAPPCTRESLSDHLCLRAQDSTVLPEPAVSQERSAPLVPPDKPVLELHSLALACISSQQLDAPCCSPSSHIVSDSWNRTQKNGQGATTNETQGVKSQMPPRPMTSATRSIPWVCMICQWRYTCLYPAKKAQGITSGGQGECCHCK